MFSRNNVNVLGDKVKMSKKYKVLISDKISQKAIETLQNNNIAFDNMPDCGARDSLIEVIEP